MLIAGDWVVDPGARPVRGGAVFIRGTHVEAVGSLEDLQRTHPSEPVERFSGCVVMPGLLNAHTRLSLSVLHGLVTSGDVLGHLRAVNSAILAMSNDDLAAAASAGALECLRCGVTSVGDLGYGPEPLAACADAGVGGVFYWEVRGIDEHALAGELQEMEFPDAGKCQAGRARCGISPQSAFASGPALIKAEWQVARRHHTGFAIHVAESDAELRLLMHGDGPLRAFAETFAKGFEPPRTGPVSYLEKLGVLDDAVAIGCTYIDPGDAARLKRHARGVVLCPRASLKLEGVAPPIAELNASGVPIALGTGSTAVGDPDLFAEARALRQHDASLTSRRLLAMMTSDAARVMGLEGTCGSFAPGTQADVAVVRVGSTEDPESAVVRLGGPGTVFAVMGAGVWRVREGKTVLPVSATERAAARAREAAAKALGG